MERGIHNSPTYKTVYIIPWTFQNPSNYSLKQFWKIILNHSKIKKMENPIVLDSKWIDLHSEYIIWYALVYFFVVALHLCFFFIAVKNVLKRTILYVHSVDLLIWSPTQLNFLFYNFFVIYYNFLKLL